MVSTTTSIDTVGVNMVILIGEVTSPPVQRTLQTGEVVSSFDMATQVEEGRISVPIACTGECDTTHVGDSVCVVGIVRRRFFRSGAGVTSRTEVLADQVISMRRKANVRKAVSRLLENLSTDLEI
jgi:single-stranded DNA-binding protein